MNQHHLNYTIFSKQIAYLSKICVLKCPTSINNIHCISTKSSYQLLSWFFLHKITRNNYNKYEPRNSSSPWTCIMFTHRSRTRCIYITHTHETIGINAANTTTTTTPCYRDNSGDIPEDELEVRELLWRVMLSASCVRIQHVLPGLP